MKHNQQPASYKGTRVGIYAGSFDPVHAGHLAFALQAVDAMQLDIVFFMPERIPRHKPGVTHYGHRVAMVRRAVRPHSTLDVLEMEDVAFSVTRTWPRLERRFLGAQLVLLCGDDVLEHLGTWPNVEKMLRQAELGIGLRERANPAHTNELLATLPLSPVATHTITSYFPTIRSSALRSALQRGRYEPGLLQTVIRYAKEEWLYI